MLVNHRSFIHNDDLVADRRGFRITDEGSFACAEVVLDGEMQQTVNRLSMSRQCSQHARCFVGCSTVGGSVSKNGVQHVRLASAGLAGETELFSITCKEGAQLVGCVHLVLVQHGCFQPLVCRMMMYTPTERISVLTSNERAKI